MMELLLIAAFVWLGVKAFGLMWKLTWGTAKLAAGLLMGLAMPVLILCLVFVGGLALLIPLAMIGIAVGIIKACL